MMKRTWLRVNWRLLPVQIGIVLTFACVPLWYRLPQRPPLLPDLYVSRFLILLPMLWSIGWWLVLGLPGFAAFRRSAIRALWALGLLSLVIWMYASQSWAFVERFHPEVAYTAVLQFGLVVLFTLAVACAAPPRRVLVGVLIFSLIWNSLLIAVQVANQSSAGLALLGEFNIGPNQSGISVVAAGDVRWLRPYGLLPHPNVLAGVLTLGLLGAVSWIVSTSRWLRWIGTLIFLGGLWAFLLTFSRAAWLGFALSAVAIYPPLRRTLKPRAHMQLWSAVLLAVILLGIFFWMYRPLISARVGEGTESVELRSVSDRIVFTEFALRSIRNRPLLGVGAGNFPWRTAFYLMATDYDLRGNNVHHVLLSVAAELGYVGYALVIAVLVLGIEAVLQMLRVASGEAPTEQRARIVLFGGFLALILVGLFDHYPWTLIQFQVAWWGLLAAALGPPIPQRSVVLVQPNASDDGVVVDVADTA